MIVSLSLSLFLRLWNAVNDPFFGWLSDKYRSRVGAVRFGGALWALSFLLIWLPVTSTFPAAGTSVLISWLHFTLALCLYDSCLTFVEVNHSALLAELSSSPVVRARCNMWAGVGAAVGSVTSMFAYMTWDPEQLAAFRVLCFVTATVSWAVFELAARGLRQSAAREPHSAAATQLPSSSSSSSAASLQVVVPSPPGDAALDASAPACPHVHAGDGGAGLRSADGLCLDCMSAPGTASRLSSSWARTATRRPNTTAATTGGGGSTGTAPVGGAASPPLLSPHAASSDGPTPPQRATLPSASPPHLPSPTKPPSTAAAAAEAEERQPSHYTTFLRQLLQHRNFLVFSIISTLQVFDCTFEKNFFALFLDLLVGSSVSAPARGAVISMSFLLPHVCTVLLTPAIQRIGLYATMNRVFCVRLGLLCVAATLGGGSSWLTCLFIMANRITSESVCRLTPLVSAGVKLVFGFCSRRS